MSNVSTDICMWSRYRKNSARNSWFSKSSFSFVSRWICCSRSSCHLENGAVRKSRMFGMEQPKFWSSKMVCTTWISFSLYNQYPLSDFCEGCMMFRSVKYFNFLCGMPVSFAIFPDGFSKLFHTAHVDLLLFKFILRVADIGCQAFCKCFGRRPLLEEV